ncbi:glycosyltransferase, partial [Variovorax sp. YR752]|uniref:glycosyltransferase n=1 Tax=Variovorax sp. YR752 TaxID=1884383 RepID=UPI003137D06E
MNRRTSTIPRATEPEVAILQYRLLQYRVPLFERLRAACESRGLRLRLVHGQPSAAEAVRRDTATLPWADVVHNRFWHIGGKDLLWQPFPAALRRARLVVMMQESRILSNYPWLFAPGSPRVAFWGHGRNFQSTAPDGLRERWKAGLRNRVDWWFAYTDLSARIVADGGYPGDRITVLDNAIDNEGFATDLATARAEQVAALRQRIGAEPGAPVGLYCGSLYPDKRLDLLVQAARMVQRARPDFRLVVLGDGPSRPLIEDAARTLPWLHWAGVQRGIDKAAWFRAADCYLSPGAVGLHVLDAFCAGLPMITTDSALHGPEIAYLASGRNGFIVPADAADYAA